MVERQPTLADLVRAHCSRFPWYEELLSNVGADADDLKSLPVLGEDLLVQHYYGVDTTSLPGASTYRTSGTASGGRKSICYSADDHAVYVDRRFELFTEFSREAPAGAPVVADLGTGHAAASAREIFDRMGFEAHDVDFSLPIRQHVDLLDAVRPVVLYTMPMILDQLVQIGGRFLESVRKVIVVGDVAPANWRSSIARTFGIGFDDVLDVYGSIELGAIAFYCAASGSYHFHQGLVPEVVDGGRFDPPAGGDPLTGPLVVTSFDRAYFPAVRYETGDRIVGLRLTEWQGQPTYAFDHIAGRVDTGELKHGERISNYDLCTAVNAVFPGVLFDASDAGRLTIRVAVDRLTADQVTAVRRAIHDLCPDVGQMVKSGLVGDIEVEAVSATELRSIRAKRSFEREH